MNGREAAGQYSLETLSEAVRYNRFIYTRMRPYLAKEVLEFGAGIGNLTPLFLEESRNVTAIDIDEGLVQVHRQRVPQQERLIVRCISIQDLASQRSMIRRFDSVVSSNVLEHIPDQETKEVVLAMKSLLRPGGYAVHWVPALPSLFGSLDKAFQHHRRYTKHTARQLFQEAGLAVVSCSYWNVTGVVGWWLYGKVLHRNSIPYSSAIAFDKFVMPLIEVCEPRMWRPFGQSLLLIAQKRDE